MPDTSLVFNLIGKGEDSVTGALGKVAVAAAATTAALAVVGAGFAAGDIEKANDKLAAQIGATPAMAEEFGGIAGELYANAYGESLTDVNDALRQVWQNGLVDEDAATADIQRVTATALDFVGAFDQDMDKTTKAVGQMIKTGMVKDATEGFDVLTRGFQQGLNSADDLLDTMNEYPIQFQKVGIDGKTAMGLISQGMKAGARDADIVADAVKEFSIRAVDGSTSAAASYKLLGLDAKKMIGEISKGGPAAKEAFAVVLDRLRAMPPGADKATAAFGLLGTQSEDLGKALNAMDPRKAADGLGTVEGAAAKMGQTLNDNAATNIESFKRKAEQAFIEIVGGRVLPIISAVASFLVTNFGPALAAAGSWITGTLVPAIASFVGWLKQNETAMVVVGTIIATMFIPHLIALGVTATVNGIKVAAAFIMTKVEAIAAAVVHSAQILIMIGSWVILGVQSLVNAARVAAAWFIALGPVGWVIATIIALVVLIIANWDTIVQITQQVWGAVWGFIQFIGDQIWDFILMVVGGIVAAWNWLGELPGKIAAWLGQALAWVGRKLGEMIQFFRDLPGKILSGLGNLGSLLIGAGEDIIRGLLHGIGNLASAIYGKIKEIVSRAWNAVLNFFGIGSPSKTMQWAGEQIGAGLVRGLGRMVGPVARAADQLADSAAVVVPSAAMATVGAGAGRLGGGGGGVTSIEIRSGGSRLDDLLVELLKGAIRKRGGDPGVLGP